VWFKGSSCFRQPTTQLCMSGVARFHHLESGCVQAAAEAQHVQTAAVALGKGCCSEFMHVAAASLAAALQMYVFATCSCITCSKMMLLNHRGQADTSIWNTALLLLLLHAGRLRYLQPNWLRTLPAWQTRSLPPRMICGPACSW
jgi:hypothetical protein